MYSISDIDDLYDCTIGGEFTVVDVNSDMLQMLYAAVVKVRRKYIELEIIDREIQDLIRYLYHLHNELAICPLNYSNEFFRRNNRIAILHSMGKAIRPSYPVIGPIIDEALAALMNLVTCDDSPLLESIEKHISFEDLTMYVPHGMYVEPINNYLNLYDIAVNVQPAGLSKVFRTINSVYCGRLLDYSPGFFHARRHHNTFLARMDHLWDQNPSLPEMQGGKYVTPQVAYKIIEDQRAVPVVKSIHLDEPDELRGEDIIEKLNSSSSVREGVLETIDARVVRLKNNNYVLLPADPDYTHHVIYDIGDNPKAGKRKLIKIDSQTAILLKQKDKSDYIVSTADRFLGTKAKRVRAQQAEWKLRLRTVIEAYGLTEISRILRSQGCLTATPQNLKNWLNPRFIRPDSTAHFIKVLEYVGYESGQMDIALSMKNIFAAHVTAGNWISQKLKLLATTDLAITDIMSQGMKTYVLDGIDDISLEAHLCENVVDGLVQAHHTELGVVRSMEDLYG